MSDSESTERRFLRSSAASYVSLFVRLGLNLGSRLLLFRLVQPGGHGLFEEALYVVTILGAFRDLGLVHHLIRDQRNPYGTILAFTTATGLFLAGLLFLGAPLAGTAWLPFLSPELPDVLRVMAVWIVLDGLMLVPRTYFERELRIGQLLIPEILRGLVMAVVSVSLAFLEWGVWSFVWGELSASFLFAVLVWARAWRQIPLQLELRLLPDLLRKGRLLFFIWLTAQLVARIDYAIIEFFSDHETVGQYARAYWIPMLVPMLVAPRALLPALVQLRNDPSRFFHAFRFGVLFIMAFQVLACYFLFLNAEKVVAIILGEQWGPAVPLLRVLCFVPLLDISAEFGGEVLKVRHEDGIWLLTILLNLTALLVFGSLFTQRWGAVGMAWANFLMIGNLLMVWRLWLIFRRRFLRLLRDLAVVYLSPLPWFLLAAWLFEPDSWARFAACAAASAVAAAILAARYQRPLRAFFSGQPIAD